MVWPEVDNRGQIETMPSLLADLLGSVALTRLALLTVSF